jgi:hypothetical protein
MQLCQDCFVALIMCILTLPGCHCGEVQPEKARTLLTVVVTAMVLICVQERCKFYYYSTDWISGSAFDWHSFFNWHKLPSCHITVTVTVTVNMTARFILACDNRATHIYFIDTTVKFSDTNCQFVSHKLWHNLPVIICHCDMKAATARKQQKHIQVLFMSKCSISSQMAWQQKNMSILWLLINFKQDVIYDGSLF